MKIEKVEKMILKFVLKKWFKKKKNKNQLMKKNNKNKFKMMKLNMK